MTEKNRKQITQCYVWIGLTLDKMADLGVESKDIKRLKKPLNIIHARYGVAQVIHADGEEWPEEIRDRWDALR